MDTFSVGNKKPASCLMAHFGPFVTTNFAMSAYAPRPLIAARLQTAQLLTLRGAGRAKVERRLLTRAAVRHAAGERQLSPKFSRLGVTRSDLNERQISGFRGNRTGG